MMLHTITRKDLLDLVYRREEDRRRMILPAIIRSDYNMDTKTKPGSIG